MDTVAIARSRIFHGTAATDTVAVSALSGAAIRHLQAMGRRAVYAVEFSSSLYELAGCLPLQMSAGFYHGI